MLSNEYTAKLKAFNLSPNYQADMEEALRVLQGRMKDGQHLFDIGCGTGFFCRKVFEAIHVAVSGIDNIVEEFEFAPDSCKHASFEDLRKAVENGDHCGQYHVVTFIHSLNHIDAPLDAVLSTAWKMLRPGGYVLILTNGHVQKAVKEVLINAGLLEQHYGDPTMIHNYSPRQIWDVMQKVGMDVAESVTYGKPEITIAGLDRLIAASSRYIVLYRKP